MKDQPAAHIPLALVVEVPLEDVHMKHNNLDVGDKDTLDGHEVEEVASQDRSHDKEMVMFLN
jgi:hypothetical protein